MPDTTDLGRELAERPCPMCLGSGVAPVADADLGGTSVTNSECPACHGFLRVPLPLGG